MKRAFLIHGWLGNENRAFFPWLRQQLEVHGFEVHIPAMPNPSFPEYRRWLECLTQNILHPDAETLVIGHSIGAKAVLAFLQDLPEGSEVGRVILVAAPLIVVGAVLLVGEGTSKPWFERPIDAEKIKKVAKDLVLFYSDSDLLVSIENEAYAREILGVKTIVEHDMGHYHRSGERGAVPKIFAEALRPLAVDSSK